MSDGEDIAGFAQRLREESWLSETTGISMDVSHQLVVHPALAELRREERDGVVVFEVEWRGERGRAGVLSAVTRDMYAACGALSERTAFIRRRVEGDALVYDVVLGDERHGHRLRFRLVGERVRRLLADYRGD